MPRPAALLASAVLLGGCTAGGPAAPPPPDRAGTPDHDLALSEPVEDSVYPEVGDPGVDALHYDLGLTWDPVTRTLAGREVLTFRSNDQDLEFQLDLSPHLEVSRVAVDGEDVSFRQDGKDLVVEAGVEQDGRYVAEIEYAGHPRPVPAPSTRADVPELGWTTTPDGETWTMQEPFGAYTWYAVNDQPSDKALYDFTLRVPEPMVGVANGELESRTTEAGQTVTEWSLDRPAASYLTTVAFGELEMSEETSTSGVPVSVWMPTEHADELPELQQRAMGALEWSEHRLGRYPYDSLGFLFVDSTSGMETQTMITLGMSEYAKSMPVLVHEVVHHWWGNLVTPRDWRDLWMSEGMALYLQALFVSDQGGPPLDTVLRQWRSNAQQLRDQAGPPGDYDPRRFADPNVYILTALLWDEVRNRMGDDTFFRLVAQWPLRDQDGTADHDELVAWWERESGVELTRLFDRHLLGETQPARGR